MTTASVHPSHPAPVTRLTTAFQWAVAAALLFPTVGSGLVLAVSAVTSWAPIELVLWSPRLLELLYVGTICVGFVSGAYWPVFSGHSKAREEALFVPRRRSAMLLSGGLALYVLLSLISVTTVTDLLQNLFAVGAILFVGTQLYAYDVGS